MNLLSVILMLLKRHKLVWLCSRLLHYLERHTWIIIVYHWLGLQYCITIIDIYYVLWFLSLRIVIGDILLFTDSLPLMVQWAHAHSMDIMHAWIIKERHLILNHLGLFNYNNFVDLCKSQPCWFDYIFFKWTCFIAATYKT